MIPENLANDFDSIGVETAVVEAPVVDSPAAEIPPAELTETVVEPEANAETIDPVAAEAELDVSGTESKPEGDPIALAKALNDEFDDIGKDEQTEKTTDLPPEKSDAAQTSDARDSQEVGDKVDPKDDPKAEKKDETDAKTEPEKVPEEAKEDWDKLTTEQQTEVDTLPKPQRKVAAENAKLANMAKAYLNPNVTPESWLKHLEKNSPSRFEAVTEEIFKQQVNALDPLKLIDTIYTATSNDEGISEKYVKILEKAVETNLEPVKAILAEKHGLKVVSKDQPDSTNSKVDLADVDISGIEDLEGFQAFKEAYPEDAEKVIEGLKKSAAEGKKDDADDDKSKAEKPDDAAAKVQQQEQTAQSDIFTTVYADKITNFVEKKLDTDLGLEVTAAERTSDPMMAFLKDAKKSILMQGYGEIEDFDNAFYEWGKNRPAFAEAAASAISFARVKEKANVERAADKMRDYADLFLNERLQLPELQMIDQMMSLYLKSKEMRDVTKHDKVPDSIGNNGSSSNGKRNLNDEFDAIT